MTALAQGLGFRLVGFYGAGLCLMWVAGLSFEWPCRPCIQLDATDRRKASRLNLPPDSKQMLQIQLSSESKAMQIARARSAHQAPRACVVLRLSALRPGASARPSGIGPIFYILTFG